MRRLILLLLLLTPAVAEPIVLSDCESPDAWKAAQNATVAADADAAVGAGAIRVGLPGVVVRTLAARALPGSAAWDRYQGLSFYVKGDGSDQWGCLAVGGENTYTYGYWFPLKDTTWHKVTAAWSEFVPEGQFEPIGAPGSLPPSGITMLRCGSRWSLIHNNYPMPRHEFSLDQVTLEETVPQPPAAPPLRPFAEVVAKLKAKQPVHIVCMGDSITAGTSLPDREKQRYAVLVGQRLRAWLGYDQVTCESRAVGGARLTDARAWAPRDFAGDPPDLVTVMYGYNDKSGAFTREAYQRSLSDYLERIARLTQGRSAVLLLATMPGTGPRFVMMDDFAEAVRETAQARNLPLVDLHALFKSVGRDEIADLFADQAHPNADGHTLMADAIAGFLARAAGVEPPRPDPGPARTLGEARSWSFDQGVEGWRLDSGEVTAAPQGGREGTPALRFTMPAPAGDHRRAWSPVMKVQPGQRYRLSAQVRCLETSAGSFGVYAAWYPTADATGEPQIQPARSASGAQGFWEPVAGNVTVPDGVSAMRVLVWAARESVGQWVVDDVTVTPR